MLADKVTPGRHLTRPELDAGLDHIRRAPQDDGVLRLIVERPKVDTREVVEEAELDPAFGLVGDSWHVRRDSDAPDGSPDPDVQLTIMSARVIDLLSGARDRWPLAGDQLYVDFDLSERNVPPGTRLAMGTAVVEVTEPPHLGCAKFVSRFGRDAMQFVNSPVGRELHLRGVNARVVQRGRIRAGDRVRKAAEQSAALFLPAVVDGAGPPFVILGGGTRGIVPLAPHAHELAKDFRVVRLQSINVEHAIEGKPLPPEYSVRSETQAMVRTLDRLGIGGAVDIAGWSYGGLIALDFALEHPDRVRTLTLFEPPALWVVPGDELRDSPDIRDIYELGLEIAPGDEPTDEQHVRFLQAVGTPGAVPSAGSPQWDDWVARRWALRCLPAMSHHHDDVARLLEFRRPALVMYGSKTAGFHLRVSDILANTLPLAERVEVDGDHLAPLTRRDEFVAHLRRFVAGAGGRS